MSAQDILEQALKLPREDRDWLAQHLWASVDEDDEELKATLNRRWDEIVSGKVETIPWEETLKRAEKAIEEARAKRKVSSGSTDIANTLRGSSNI